jgi:hypothetical protein
VPKTESDTKRIDKGLILKALGEQASQMRAFSIVWYLAVSLFLAYGGWLLIFRTSTIVRRAHSQYHCNFFLKPWYSIFMRCIGIFIWLLTALTDYALLTLR